MDAVNNDFGKYVQRCSDKYELMPPKSKDKLLEKVFLVALAAGVIAASTIVLLPLAPVVALVAGGVAFLHYADEFRPEVYALNNSAEAMRRALNEPQFRKAAYNRIREDGPSFLSRVLA